MANKRMFSMKIVDTDDFLDMPLTTQALYFHLNMRADDDGFIGNPKRIQRLIGAGDDDLKLLIAKKFVLIFENGVIVIKHWRMHNTLSVNRYTETAYTDEKSRLLLKDNKSYSFNKGLPINDAKRLKSPKSKNDVELLLNNCRTNVEQSPNTDIDKGIDKDLDKDIDKDLDKEPIQAELVDSLELEFNSLWSIYKRKVGKDSAYKAYMRVRKGYKDKSGNHKPVEYETIKNGIELYNQEIEFKKTEQQFIKHLSTWLNGRCWEDEYETEESKKQSEQGLWDF